VLLFLTLPATPLFADPPTDAPTNVSVVAGEGFAVLSYDDIPGRTFWAFHNAGTTVSLEDYDLININIDNPAFISNLDNGTQYAFAVTSSVGSSPVGPFSTNVTATPRLLSPAVPWTVAIPLTSNKLNDITYFNELYVTVGDAATVFVGNYEYLATEPTFGTAGISSWNQPASLPVAGGVNLVEVIHDGLRYVALGDDGSIIHSEVADALTWEAGTAITAPPTMNSIAVGAGRYVAVGDGGAIYYTTADGATSAWTEVTPVTGNDLLAVKYLFGTFIAVGRTGTLLTSSDGGITWNVRTSNTANDLHEVTVGTDFYVAVGDVGTIINSTDTIDWTLQTSPTAESLRDIIFATDDQYIAVGTNGAVAYSESGDDGSWSLATEGTADLNAVASNLVNIAAGDAGGHISGR